MGYLCDFIKPKNNKTTSAHLQLVYLNMTGIQVDFDLDV